MIKITYNPRKWILDVEGHAEAGPYGQDLVCCAVSVLVQTLAETLKRTEPMLNGLVAEVEPGKAHIQCAPMRVAVDKTLRSYHQTMIGLRALEDEFPKNIKIHVANDRER